ncbi:DUF4288 domain-containing protein [Nocardioides sp. AN3]
MTGTIRGMGWYGVRSVYLFEAAADGGDVYEERVVLFVADSFDAAIAKAEEEAAEYVALLEEGEVLPLFQSYSIADEVEHGAEVFSLMRSSELRPDAYLDHFFDTGQERQRSTE